MNLLADAKIPDDLDIVSIVNCATSEKWQIRHSAIIAIGASAVQKSRDSLAFGINQCDEKKYRYEIIYASSSLGKIGVVSDIKILEKHINSRIRDIKESVRNAIESIKLNNGL